MILFTVKKTPYHKWNRNVTQHFCQICNTPLEEGKIFWVLTSPKGPEHTRWACSEVCSELICLTNETNYKGRIYL